MRPTIPTILLVSAVLLLTSARSAAQAAPGIPPEIGRKRVLLAFADTASDPAVDAQRRILQSTSAEAVERDLVFIPAIGPESDALRRRYRVPANTFQVLLIGKDGGEKLRDSAPIQAARLFALIDTMPMRRAERRR